MGRPSANRRVAAIAAVALVAAVTVVTAVTAVSDAGGSSSSWRFWSRRWQGCGRPRRVRVSPAVVGAVVALAAVIAIGVTIVIDEGLTGLSLALRIVALVVAVGLARYALGTTLRSLKAAEVPGTPVPPAQRGVLFMNLRSGSGKAERFHLVDECHRRGIEPQVLEPGQDWLQRVRDSAESGVDVLGMAGGDGSQAMVATVAAEFGLPMVVVPPVPGTTWHSTWGSTAKTSLVRLTRTGMRVERRLDLADVNGHVFVNNVSLGLYAAIVRLPNTVTRRSTRRLATLPKVLGPAKVNRSTCVSPGPTARSTLAHT